MNKLFLLSVLIAGVAATTKTECDNARLWARNTCRGKSAAQKADKTQPCYKRTKRANNFCARCPARRQDCGVDNRMCGDWAGITTPDPAFNVPCKPGTGAGCSTFLATCAPVVSGRTALVGGHCKDPEHGNPGYMLRNCANTCCEICRSCPVENRLDQCTPDGYGQCSQWASMGECDANTVWMHQHCMGSCCPNCPKGCPTTPEGCTNSYSESKCVAWASVGECDRNPGWMSQNCQKECCPTCRRPAPAPIMQPMYGGFAPQNFAPRNPYSNPYASLPYYG